VVVPQNSELAFDSDNQKVVYDINIPELSDEAAFEQTQKYISYNAAEIRSIR
jgi:hypothetical protein